MFGLFRMVERNPEKSRGAYNRILLNSVTSTVPTDLALEIWLNLSH